MESKAEATGAWSPRLRPRHFLLTLVATRDTRQSSQGGRDWHICKSGTSLCVLRETIALPGCKFSQAASSWIGLREAWGSSSLWIVDLLAKRLELSALFYRENRRPVFLPLKVVWSLFRRKQYFKSRVPVGLASVRGLCVVQGGAGLVSVEKSDDPASLDCHLFFAQPSPLTFSTSFRLLSQGAQTAWTSALLSHLSGLLRDSEH